MTPAQRLLYLKGLCIWCASAVLGKRKECYKCASTQRVRYNGGYAGPRYNPRGRR